MHIQHKYPLTSTPPFCHSIYINTLIGRHTCIGEYYAELIGGGRAVSPQPLLLIPEVVAGWKPDNTLWESFPNFKGKIYFLCGESHILVQ